MDLDKLLGDIDALGMDEEIARNVEPVRRVIERSLKNENYRLSDILTGEVYDNVEKLLKENYISGLKESEDDSMEEIDRLRKLGVEEKEWDFLLKMSQDVLDEYEIITPWICGELSCGIANIDPELLRRKIDREIDSRIERLKRFIKEGLDFGFDLEWYEIELMSLRKGPKRSHLLEILKSLSLLNRNWR